MPATIPPAHPLKREPRPGRHPVTLQRTNPDPVPHLTSPCWERMEHSSTLFTATPLGCRGKEAAKNCWLGGPQSLAGQGALEQVRMLPELPSFVSPTANVLLFPPASGFRGENPHLSSTSWEQCDGDVPAMAACHDGSIPTPWRWLSPGPGAGLCWHGIPGLGPAEAGKGLAGPRALPPPAPFGKRKNPPL